MGDSQFHLIILIEHWLLSEAQALTRIRGWLGAVEYL